MAWTKFDDGWTGKRLAEGMNFEEIGYLVALLQHCSKNDVYDGRITAFAARTMGPCSDVDAILGHIIQLGHAEWDGGFLVMTRIEDHVPSEEVRDRAAAERDKKRRQRAHGRGDHSLCSQNCPGRFPGTVPGTVPGTDEGQGSAERRCPPDVPGTVGAGQGGQGQEELPPNGNLDENDPWYTPSPPHPGGVDLTTGEIDEDDYLASAGVCGRCRGQGCPDCWDSMDRSA